MIKLDYSNITIDLNQPFQNPGCSMEIEAIIKRCTDFKAEVLTTMNTRFKVAVIIMIIIILLTMILKYSKYSDHPGVQFILRRLEWIGVVVAILTIGLMFL